MQGLQSFSTERFTARPVTDRDGSLLATIMASKEAGSWLSVDREPLSQTDIGTALQFFLDCWQEGGVGPWMFFEKSNPETFIGYAGLWKRAFDGVVENELSYAIHPNFWRLGYGREIGFAALYRGFEIYQFPSIIAVTIAENTASLGLMRSLGMHYEKDVMHGGLPHQLFRITR